MVLKSSEAGAPVRYSCLNCGKIMSDKFMNETAHRGPLLEVHLDMNHPRIVCEKCSLKSLYKISWTRGGIALVYKLLWFHKYATILFYKIGLNYYPHPNHHQYHTLKIYQQQFTGLWLIMSKELPISTLWWTHLHCTVTVDSNPGYSPDLGEVLEEMVAKARGDSGKWMCLQCGKDDIRLMIMIKTIKMAAYDYIVYLQWW